MKIKKITHIDENKNKNSFRNIAELKKYLGGRKYNVKFIENKVKNELMELYELTKFGSIHLENIKKIEQNSIQNLNNELKKFPLFYTCTVGDWYYDGNDEVFREYNVSKEGFLYCDDQCNYKII